MRCARTGCLSGGSGGESSSIFRVHLCPLAMSTGHEIEKWIRRRLCAAVQAGIGEWSNASHPAFGNGIYQVSHGSKNLLLCQLGFQYRNGSIAFEFAYNDVKDLLGATLPELLRLRGELYADVKIEILPQDDSAPHVMILPYVVYSDTYTALSRPLIWRSEPLPSGVDSAA
jgi:hypothetical protein